MIKNEEGVSISDWDGFAWKDRPTLQFGPEYYQYGSPFGSLALDTSGKTVVFLNSFKTAQVFIWDGSSWMQKGNTLLVEGNRTNWQSSHISADGNTIILRSAFWNDNQNPSYLYGGEVRAYKWTGTKWELMGNPIKLKDNIDRSKIINQAEMDQAGKVIALGVTNAKFRMGPTAFAQVYEWNGNNWGQKGSDIVDPDRIGNAFLRSLSLSPTGNSIAVGWGISVSSGKGKATVHFFNNTDWMLKGKAFESDKHYFAWDVSLTNNKVALTSWQELGVQGCIGGLVETFHWDSSHWVKFGQTLCGDSIHDHFGREVHLSRDGKHMSVLAVPRLGHNTYKNSYTRVYANNIYFHTENITTCDSLVWRNGKTYFSSISGEKDTIQSNIGCDSIITLNLKLHKSVNNKVEITSCDSFTWINGLTYYSNTDTPRYLLKTKYGCDSLLRLSLVINKTPILEPFVDTTLCFGDSILVKGLANSADLLWNTGSTSGSIWVKKGNYTLTAKNGVCSTSESIRVKEYAPISVALEDNFYICEKENELIKLDAGKGFLKYLWYPTNDTTQWIEIGKVGEYYVVVNDFRGCEGDKGTRVNRRCDIVYFIPDAFSPNRDGVNDYFIIKGEGIEKVYIHIFDRWGGKVYEGSDPKGWSGSNAAEGVYLYLLRVEGFYKKSPVIYNHSGTVTLIR